MTDARARAALTAAESRLFETLQLQVRERTLALADSPVRPGGTTPPAARP